MKQIMLATASSVLRACRVALGTTRRTCDAALGIALRACDAALEATERQSGLLAVAEAKARGVRWYNPWARVGEEIEPGVLVIDDGNSDL